MKTSFITSPAALMAGLVAMSLLLAACGDKSTAKDDHGSKPSATAQAHDEPETLTQFTDKTELFLEFPPLVVGQPATLAAHLTRLADFKPIAQGKLTIVLAGGRAPTSVLSSRPRQCPASSGRRRPPLWPASAN
jgi:cobalt-zinc-cadmium efflux system membrane fusion protein